MDPVRLSKLLAFVLRHRPEAIGVELDGDGWTSVDILIERLNKSGRVTGLDREGLARLVAQEGATRYAIEGGRIRAIAGHTTPSVVFARAVPVAPPDFLFFGVPKERVAYTLTVEGLGGEPGRPLRLFESERAARRAALGPRRGRVRVVVVEAQRAARAGVAFLQIEPGVILATSVPRRFLLSERPGFERQISAGAVLVRRRGEPAPDAPADPASIEIALIRTKPRGELEERPLHASDDELPALGAHDVEPAPSVSPPALASDRRSGEDRRKADEGPPDGVERRQGTRRRRRRRGWGAEGRMELPKGKIESGETPCQAAIRELREETGLLTAIDLVRELPRVRYAFRTPDGKSVFKVVHYFLFMSRDPAPQFVPQGKEGIVAVEWTSLRDALETIAFGNLRPVLESVRDALTPGAVSPPLPEED